MAVRGRPGTVGTRDDAPTARRETGLSGPSQGSDGRRGLGREVADDLRRRILGASSRPGGKLPTEAELGAATRGVAGDRPHRPAAPGVRAAWPTSATVPGRTSRAMARASAPACRSCARSPTRSASSARSRACAGAGSSCGRRPSARPAAWASPPARRSGRSCASVLADGDVVAYSLDAIPTSVIPAPPNGVVDEASERLGQRLGVRRARKPVASCRRAPSTEVHAVAAADLPFEPEERRSGSSTCCSSSSTRPVRAGGCSIAAPTSSRAASSSSSSAPAEPAPLDPSECDWAAASLVALRCGSTPGGGQPGVAWRVSTSSITAANRSALVSPWRSRTACRAAAHSAPDRADSWARWQRLDVGHLGQPDDAPRHLGRREQPGFAPPPGEQVVAEARRRTRRGSGGRARRR